MSEDEYEEGLAVSTPRGDYELSGTRWIPAPGAYVEVQELKGRVRRGFIETVTNDKSGFWLAADGVEPRLFVSLEDTTRNVRLAPLPA